MRRTGNRVALAAMLALAVVLGACSSDDAADGWATTTDAGGVDADRPGFEEIEEAPAADLDVEDGADDATSDVDVAPGPQAGSTPMTAEQAGRRVIRTAELVLELDDPAAAADEVVRIAEDAGGFVATADLSRDEEGVVTGTITLRVPSAELLATVDAIDALAAAVPVRRIDEQDVTTESRDLEAQLTNLRAYEAELRDLLGDVSETSDRANDLLTVFERIRSVREEIDRLEGRLELLDDQVSLATISVTLLPTTGAVPVADPTWSIGDTVREALSATARGLSRIVDVAVWLVLTAIPLVAVLALPLVLVALGWRALARRRRARWAPPPPPPTDPAGDPAPVDDGPPTTDASVPAGTVERAP